MAKKQMVVGSIRLKAELWQEIHEVGKRLNTKPAEVVRMAIALGLEHLYPKEPAKRRGYGA